MAMGKPNRDAPTGLATNLLAAGCMFSVSAVFLLAAFMALLALLVRGSSTPTVLVGLATGAIGIILLGGAVAAVTGRGTFGRRAQQTAPRHESPGPEDGEERQGEEETDE